MIIILFCIIDVKFVSNIFNFYLNIFQINLAIICFFIKHANMYLNDSSFLSVLLPMI